MENVLTIANDDSFVILMNMSKPVLYYTPRSPPSRAVLMTAAAIGVELDLRFVNLKAKEHLTPEFLKLNPHHTIPVLDDNGTVVIDSHVICAYLADKYAKDDSIYPKDAAKRRLVDARMYFGCGHLFPRFRLIAEFILYFGATEITEEKIKYMQIAYEGIENCLKDSDYLCGNQLTIADLCCIAPLSSAIMFAAADQQRFPKLNAWVARISALPFYEETNQKGANMLAEAIKNSMIENQKAKQN